MNRSRPTSVLAALFLLLTVPPARAQFIEVPAFPVGPAVEPGWFLIYQVFDVGAAADGGFAAAWLESHSTSSGTSTSGPS